MAAVSLAAALLLATSIDVQSATDCPSAAAVSARLARLLPPPDPLDHTAPDRVALRLAGPDLDVTLVREPAGGGEEIALGERRLPSGGRSCAELAELAAVLVASWELDPRAAVSLALAPPPAAPAARAAPPAPAVLRAAPAAPAPRTTV